MADNEDDVIFERPEIASNASRQKESQMTCGKLVVSVVLAASFFGLGLCLAIPGPTLVDLEENTNSTSGHITLIFTSRSFGYLLGSIFGGFLFSYINQAFLLSITMMVTAVATAVAPFCRTLIQLAVMIMLQGISMGFMDTGGNVLCLDTWGRDNGPHLQALHSAFGFGAFLAPLLAAPFLHAGNSSAVFDENVTVTTKSPDVNDETDASNKTASIMEMLNDDGVSPVKYAYLIIAVFVGLVSLAFLTLCCCARKRGGTPDIGSLKSEYAIRQERLGVRIQLLVLLFIFFFLYVGSEVTYGSLISRFAYESFHWSKREAALLNSLFWGAFAVGRFLAIFLAQCFEPVHLLVVDLVVSTVSLIGLSVVESIPQMLSNKVSKEFSLYVLTSTLGFGMASIFPSGLSWAERYIKVTGPAASIFVVGSALGEMVLPALTGYIFVYVSPIWLMYVLLVALFVSAVVFVLMMNVACSMGERYSKLPNQDEDMELLKVTDDDGLASSPTDYPNGHDSSDRKKRVTFTLNSDSAHSNAKDGGAKASILRSKRMEKKD